MNAVHHLRAALSQLIHELHFAIRRLEINDKLGLQPTCPHQLFIVLWDTLGCEN